MQIAIDITRAIIENAGIGRYTREITKHLIESDQDDDFLLVSTHWRDQKEEIIRELKAKSLKLKRVKIPGNFKEAVWGWKLPVWDNLYEKSDVLLAPSFFEAKLSLKIPQVVTIHDMSTFLFPEQRGKEVSERHNKRVRLVCAKAKHIIAVSQSTKNDIMRLLNIPSDKITVIYPGLNKPITNNFITNNFVSKNYILFVGTLEPRKNLKRLLTAYRLLPTELRDKYQLVIVGAKGWNTNKEIEEIRDTKGVEWLGYQTDEELASLYKNATIFAYPSLYEGFGLPIIEAQQHGVPVLTSNVSSLPEAVGEGGLQIDPTDEKAIARGLQELLEGKELRQDLSKKALENAKRFSWEKSAQETLKVLKEGV